MATWLFRGNPKDFNVDAYLRTHRDIQWYVHQRNLHAVSMPSVTNYKLTAVEEARLTQVWEGRRVRDL
jgi:beta-glucanase (GH16 family)